MKNNQKGFGAVEVLLVIVLLAIIGFLGWRFYTNQDKDSNTQEPTSQTTETDQVPEVNSSSDLDEAEDYLKSSDIDKELDTSEIDGVIQ